MPRALGIVLVLALVAAGCGVRNSKPFTAQGTAGCLKANGFTGVTTDPGKVGFIAGFADNGGIQARSATGNVLTIAFTADPASTGIPRTRSAACLEEAAAAYRRRHAGKPQRGARLDDDACAGRARRGNSLPQALDTAN